MEEGVPPSLNTGGRRRAGSCPFWLVLLAHLILIALLITIIFLLSYFTWNPSVPRFDVDRVAIIGGEQDHQLDITMKVRNPSILVDLYHKRDGKVDLSHEGKQIASTEPPNFFIETKDTEEIKFSLKSSDAKLQQDLTSTAKELNDIDVPLSLSADIPVKSDGLRSLRSRRRGLKVTCEFKVKRTANELKVASQECEAKFS